MARAEAPLPIHNHPLEDLRRTVEAIPGWVGRYRTSLALTVAALGIAGVGYWFITHDSGSQNPPIQPTTPVGDTFKRPDSGLGVVIPAPETATPIPKPTETEKSLLYKVEGEKQFGGFEIAIEAADGRPVGFTDQIEGPKQLYKQLMLMLAYQSGQEFNAASGNVDQIAQNTADRLQRNNQIVFDFRLPVLDLRTPIDASRSPSYVKPSEPQVLDLRQPIKIIRASTRPEGVDKIYFGDQRHWDAMYIDPETHQLVFIISDTFPIQPERTIDISDGMYLWLEATAGIRKVTPDSSRMRNEAYLDVIMNLRSRGYNARDTVIDRRVFWNTTPDFLTLTGTLFNVK